MRDVTGWIVALAKALEATGAWVGYLEGVKGRFGYLDEESANSLRAAQADFYRIAQEINRLTEDFK